MLSLNWFGWFLRWGGLCKCAVGETQGPPGSDRPRVVRRELRGGPWFVDAREKDGVLLLSCLLVPYIFCLPGSGSDDYTWCIAAVWHRCDDRTSLPDFCFPGLRQSRKWAPQKQSSTWHIVCTECVFIISRCTYRTCEKMLFFWVPDFFKKSGDSKNEVFWDSNMFRYTYFPWMVLSHDGGFGDDHRCGGQNSASEVVVNCRSVLLSRTVVCHIVYNNCMSVILSCTYRTCQKKSCFLSPCFFKKKIRNSKNAIFLVFCRVTLPCSMFSFVSAGYCGGLVYSNSRLHLLKSTAWSWKSNVSNGSLVKLRCCRGLTFGIARCRFGGMMLSSQPNVFLNHIAVPSHSPFCFVRPCCA